MQLDLRKSEEWAITEQRRRRILKDEGTVGTKEEFELLKQLDWHVFPLPNVENQNDFTCRVKRTLNDREDLVEWRVQSYCCDRLLAGEAYEVDLMFLRPLLYPAGQTSPLSPQQHQHKREDEQQGIPPLREFLRLSNSS